MIKSTFSTRARRAGLILFAVVGVVVAVQNSRGSDHVDTAEVELSPQLDLNDVYVFPGSSDGRIVLVMDVASPISRIGGAEGARFSPNALYEFNITNDGDPDADLVIQFLFDNMSDGSTRVNVIGPAAPDNTGLGATERRLISGPVAGGAFNETFTDSTGQMQVFAGPRSDPFYLDFEQVVRILPDRRPFTFLNDTTQLAPLANAFRPEQSACSAEGQITGDPGPFDTDHGCAVNFFDGANALTIVVEMPESMLGVDAGNAEAQIGVWAAISR